MPYKDPIKRQECNRRCLRTFYRKHKSQVIADVARRRRKLQALVDKRKRSPCSDCGLCFPPCAMDFDHRDPEIKEDKVSALIQNGVSEARILQEIAKCDLVCANCHRIRTHIRRPRRLKVRTLVFQAENMGSNPVGVTS